MNTLQNVYDKLSDKTELAKHEVELGYLQSVQKDAENQLKKYSDIPELMKFHNEANQWITKNKSLVENFNTTRKIYLDKLEYEIDKLNKELLDIDAKFKSIGIKSEENPEYNKAREATAKAYQLLLGLETRTKQIQITFN